jgi:hypothetical protein
MHRASRQAKPGHSKTRPEPHTALVWLAFVIVGFAIKALPWSAIQGTVLFIAAGIYGAPSWESTISTP